MKYTRPLIVAICALITLAVLGDSSEICAQPNAKQKFKKAGTQVRVGKPTPKPPDDPIVKSAIGPVSVVNAALPDYLSGETSVTVNPKQPTIIRLGLAQNAVSIVEFPASDGIYYIHEGNPKLASIFQSPTKETDRSITIYPGESFLPARAGTPLSTAISLQMRSGLVLILELVPVADIRKNAHRCVIRYNREDVIAARRTAGLAFGLGEDIKTPPAPSSKAASKLMLGALAVDGKNELEVINGPVQPPAMIEIKAAGLSKAPSKPSVPRSDREISLLANKKLADCIRDPRKHLGSWSKPLAGIELAVTRVAEIDSELRLVIVAVRNGTTGNLRLLPGSPELQLRTSDDKGNSLQTERIERRYVESTSMEGLVHPGATVYYALVYKAPILGTNQNIRVLASHREAADAPIAVPLASVETKKE